MTKDKQLSRYAVLRNRKLSKSWRRSFKGMEDQIYSLLTKNPTASALELFKRLMITNPQIDISLLRTFQRRVQDWKLLNGRNNNYQQETIIKHEKMMPFLIMGDIERFPYTQSCDINKEDYYNLFAVINTGKKRDRIKAISIIARSYGISMSIICRFLHVCDNTLRTNIAKFKKSGFKALFAYNMTRIAKSINPTYCNAVFEILHSPPSSHNINRTSWKLEDIKQIMGSIRIRQRV